jgi:pimeloyl-ACP methyl ester carboxylesterase
VWVAVELLLPPSRWWQAVGGGGRGARPPPAGAPPPPGDRDAALEMAFRDMVGMPPPAVAAMKGSPVWAEWRSLAHTWPREMREVLAMPTGTDGLDAVTTPTLLLCGTLSPEHHRRACDALVAVLPTATLAELPGQGHGALATAPDRVAAAIRDFAPQSRS